MATATHAIEVRGLVREFKKGPRAVDGIDLHVDQGEIYGFLGPNGAGKSTTVKMLVTLLPPSGGQALVWGYDVARRGADVRRMIGVALQEAALDPLLTAREHLALQAGLHGFDRSASRARSEELLERVGLTGAAQRKVGTYSGGMKRRLDLAMALVHQPRVLFLDEPTTGLDPQSRGALWDEVGRLAHDEGVTVFLTTQYLEEADALANRVGIINHGQIVAEGTPAELKAQVGSSTVEVVPEQASEVSRVESILRRFGDPAPPSPNTPNSVAVHLRDGGGGVSDVVRALDSAGVAVAHVALNAPTLDDVFLAKTGRTLEGAAAGGEPVEGEPEPRVEDAVPAPLRFGTRVTGIHVRQLLTGGEGGGVPTLSGTSFLLVRQGPLSGQKFEIADRVVVGREGDVVFDDREVSRRHALFRVVEGSLVVEDLGSLNGTWVNGHRITTRTLLSAGDQVTIGKSAMEVQAGAGAGG